MQKNQLSFGAKLPSAFEIFLTEDFKTFKRRDVYKQVVCGTEFENSQQKTHLVRHLSDKVAKKKRKI